MAQAQFIHDGDEIDYTPGADVSAGDVVVQGDLVGVTKPGHHGEHAGRPGGHRRV